MNLIKFNRPARRNAFGPVLDDFFKLGMPDFLGTDFSNTSPATNIIQNDDSFEIELAAPGMTKENFDIKVDKNTLTISASMSSESNEEDEKTNYTKREFNYSSFSKSFNLPQTIDSEKISAIYDNGVLRLKLKIKEEAKVKEAKKIEIK